MKQAALIFVALLFIAVGGIIVMMGMRMGRPAVEVRKLTVQPTNAAPPPRAKKDLPAGWLDEFTLTERSGKKFDSKAMAGKVWAASFFFADCPGECHQQNLAIAQVAKEFGPKGVTFVSITVNPERDTSQRLQEYARTYTKSPDEWLFLTGELDYIRRVGAEFFGVAVDKSTHGSRLILVDKWGNLRGYYSTNGKQFPEEYAAIRPKLRELLAEEEPPAEFKPEGAQGDSAHGNEPTKPTSDAGDDATHEKAAETTASE